MRNHYVPRYYLKGFIESPLSDLIWAYDKLDDRVFKTSVGNVANENDFYSEELEGYLAEEVEFPANEILTQIREQQVISTAQKRVLAQYFVVMLKRVPRNRERVKQLAPEVARSVSRNLDEHLDRLLRHDPGREGPIERRRQEGKEICVSFGANVPQEFLDDLIRPERSVQLIRVLESMIWTFFTSETNMGFVTSDNPVFFFESMGIGRPESEVSIPISTDIALFATFKRTTKGDFIPAKPQLVKEINRRTISRATRFIFHSANEPWVLRNAKKKNANFHRIV